MGSQLSKYFEGNPPPLQGLWLIFVVVVNLFFGHAVQPVGSNQGSNPCPLQWKCSVLTTGPPGMFLWLILCLKTVALPHENFFFFSLLTGIFVYTKHYNFLNILHSFINKLSTVFI